MTAQNTIWNIDPIAVPLNTRLSEKEIDHVLVDATPHGLLEIFGKNLTYKGGNNVEQ